MIQYDFLSAETHNQTSVIHNYREEGEFKFRGLRVTSQTSIGLIAQMISRYLGEILQQIITLYCSVPPFDAAKWWNEIFNKSEELIKFNKEIDKNTMIISVSLSNPFEFDSTS